jgi:hypothetical protein
MRRELSAGDRVTERTFCAALAERWTVVGESSGVDVGGDTTSERGEASAIDRDGRRVELEPLG